MLRNCWLDPEEQTSVKFKSELNIFFQDDELENVVCEMTSICPGLNVLTLTVKCQGDADILTSYLMHQIFYDTFCWLINHYLSMSKYISKRCFKIPGLTRIVLSAISPTGRGAVKWKTGGNIALGFDDFKIMESVHIDTIKLVYFKTGTRHDDVI